MAKSENDEKPAVPNDSPPRVADIPRFKEIATQVAVARTIGKWAPRIAPVARLFGIDLARAVKAAEEIEALAPTLAEHVHFPDRFNKLYASRGWIAYSLLNHQTMLNAISSGERGDFDVGEHLLVEQYDERFLEFNVTRISSLDNFRDRVELARLSMRDFLDGRFHACVPNVLMLIDGLASDVSGKSIFSDKSDPTSWNSVVGHHTALPALVSLLNTRRMTRRTEALSIPFRHGILHGRDLGFANRTVAAKCWGALFAVAEWAKDLEEGRKRPPPPKPRRSISERLREFSRQASDLERLKQWRPRPIHFGVDLPATGEPSEYTAGTPERTLVEFLSCWRQRDFGDMAKLVTIGRDRVDPRARAGEINRRYRSYRLREFRLMTVTDRSPNASAYDVRCSIEGAETADLSFLVVREDPATGDWLYTSFDQGSWRVHNWDSALFRINMAKESSTAGPR